MTIIHRLRFFLVALALQSSSFWIGFCRSFAIQQREKTWQYKGHPIGYEEASNGDGSGSGSAGLATVKEPILLLNGFGVGSFHQHRLMQRLLEQEQQQQLSSSSTTRTIYGMDYLGQGRSWPENCNDGLSESERGLIYSGDTWVDQTIQFIEQVMLQDASAGTKVHLVGNSVGGHLATYIAALRPDLIESVCLLNATPVWGLNLPGW
jgi:pimeloyl-ACP methyl ester carboxylesterase